MILINLGYERENLQRSDQPGDVPHGWHRDRATALCGVSLGTAFESILFATPGGYESDGHTPYNTRAHTETFSKTKCAECIEIAAAFDDPISGDIEHGENRS